MAETCPGLVHGGKGGQDFARIGKSGSISLPVNDNLLASKEELLVSKIIFIYVHMCVFDFPPYLKALEPSAYRL